MTFVHVYNKIQCQIQNEDNTRQHTKSYIIKKQTNNKVSFVKFILNNWQFKVMTMGSQSTVTLTLITMSEKSKKKKNCS